MKDLQTTIEDVARAIGNAERGGSPIVGVSKEEARQLIDAAQLVVLLVERCQLLGRALAAVWSLVSEEDRQEITAVLDAPTGAGKTLPAVDLVQLLERKGAKMNDGGVA